MIESDANAAELACLVPKEGCEVFARVDKVEDRFCRLKILAINNRPLAQNSHFTGIIFKENVRDYDRDGIQMHKCFVPNDIVKARVIQESSGQGTSCQLSTVEDTMGVKYAWS